MFARERLLPGVGILSGAGWLTEQAVTRWLGEWWSVIPFGWTAIGLAIFWVGSVFADWKDDRSRLKQWWYRRLAFIELVYTVPASEIVDGIERFVVRAKIRFTKKASSCDGLLKINATNSGGEESVAFWSNRSFSSGEHATIDIAHISSRPPQPGHISYWGRDENKHVLENGNYIVDVQITANGRTQAFKVRIDMLQQGTWTSGRFWMADDHEDLFEI